jgi:hypothetical protein
LAALSWSRYGHPAKPTPAENDELLDHFMPDYDVVERHQVRVAAPPAITLALARDMDIQRSPVARAIFRIRELVLGAPPDDTPRPRGLLAEVQALGWGVLSEESDREIVVGAVTKPWEPNTTFRAIAPESFAAFQEPGYVKIAWTLRADPIDDDARDDGEGSASMFRTETRAIATDAASRARFRTYWAFFSPGIALIRRLSLAPLKADAERAARQAVAR